VEQYKLMGSREDVAGEDPQGVVVPIIIIII
jgi:hypothetical protein